MCTVTVHRSSSETLVTMNRDEMLTRAPESPPKLHDDGGSSWIAPHDSAKGGTWMGVNASGVTACLLNAYLPGESLLPDATGRYPSRGEIIPALLRHGGADEALDWLLHTFDPHDYPSFTLLVATRDATTCYEWYKEGRPSIREVEDEWIIRSSAGWDSEEVRLWREERFTQWREGGCASHDTLPAFHILQDPENEDYSPLMRRDWSATRSITQALVDFQSGNVDLRYWSEPSPDTREPTARMHLGLESLETDSIDSKA